MGGMPGMGGPGGMGGMDVSKMSASVFVHFYFFFTGKKTNSILRLRCWDNYFK